MPDLPQAIVSFLEALGAITLVCLGIAVLLLALAWAFYPLDKGDRR